MESYDTCTGSQTRTHHVSVLIYMHRFYFLETTKIFLVVNVILFFFLLPVVSIFIVLYVHRINVLKTFDLIVIPWALILLTSTNNHGFVFQTLPVLINIIIPMLKMFSEHQNNFNVERIWLVVSAIFASFIVIVSFSSSDFFFVS